MVMKLRQDQGRQRKRTY